MVRHIARTGSAGTPPALVPSAHLNAGANCHDQTRATTSRRPSPVQEPLRKLYWRQVGETYGRKIFRKHYADHRQACSARSRVPTRMTSNSRSTRRTPRRKRWGRTRPPSARTSSTRSPIAWKPTSTCRACRDVIRQVAARDARRRHAARDRPSSATSPVASARRKVRSARSTTTVAYQFHEPLGVVAQIIPWNFRC